MNLIDNKVSRVDQVSQMIAVVLRHIAEVHFDCEGVLRSDDLSLDLGVALRLQHGKSDRLSVVKV